MSPASNQFPNGNLSKCGYHIWPHMFLKIEEHHGKFFQTQKQKTSKSNMGQLKLIDKADVLVRSLMGAVASGGREHLQAN